jgi:hypothetical protein
MLEMTDVCKHFVRNPEGMKTLYTPEALNC